MSKHSKRRKPLTTYRSRDGRPTLPAAEESAEIPSGGEAAPEGAAEAGSQSVSEASAGPELEAQNPEPAAAASNETAPDEASEEGASPAPAKPKKFRSFLKSTGGRVCILAAAVIVLAAACFGGYAGWYYVQPKFQDYTIELGTESVSLADFLTSHAKADKVHFVSDVSAVNIDEVGETQLVLAQGQKEETVTLSVVAPTPPEVTFVSELEKPLSYVPNPEDFVVSAEDLSAFTISFAEPVTVSDRYDDLTVTVVVTDASGNASSAQCLLSYVWLKPSFTLELGETLTSADVLYDASLGESGLLPSDLLQISSSGTGVYTLTGTYLGKTESCTVTVVDTTAPVLEVQDVVRYLDAEDKAVSASAFVVSAEDASGDVELRMTTDLSYDTVGAHSVTIEAADASGNVTSAQATYWLKADDNPPVISGLANLTLDKHSEAPDYLTGVTAADSYDGACEVLVDDSGVDYDAAGTYYVTYTAVDASGNEASAKAKVVISHDEEDTAALVASIAESVGSDPKKLQEYVRSHVSYSTSYGGSDPVWYGFTNKTGNCYVHASCLAALYDYFGIENYIIWTTDKTHYWNIVMTSSGYKHIDSTPASKHPSRYMSDADRYANLQGRNWDRSKWPKCS